MKKRTLKLNFTIKAVVSELENILLYNYRHLDVIYDFLCEMTASKSCCFFVFLF